jgi:hypothetical protein
MAGTPLSPPSGTTSFAPSKIQINIFKQQRRQHSTFPRHDVPESCVIRVPLKTRGRREGRVQAAPMARQQIKKLAAVTTGLAEHPAFPAQRF